MAGRHVATDLKSMGQSLGLLSQSAEGRMKDLVRHQLWREQPFAYAISNSSHWSKVAVET
jgi:hypothetical protein